MILSASRRTDIPAFYWDWFLEGLNKGEFLVPNPYNKKLWRRVKFDKGDIDMIVFWSKNPKTILRDLDKIKDYNFYLQCTLTSYGKDIEKNVPNKNQTINILEDLAKRIGKERIIWRYDPIILSDKYTKEYHLKYFELLCKRMVEVTDTIVVSFLEEYRKIKGRFDYYIPSKEEKVQILTKLKEISDRYNMTLKTCCAKEDYSSLGIDRNSCIDKDLIEKLLGQGLKLKSEPYKRDGCGCVESIDIGWYSSCPHICSYCYANNAQIVGIPKLDEGAEIKDYICRSNIVKQRSLF